MREGLQWQLFEERKNYNEKPGFFVFPPKFLISKTKKLAQIIILKPL